MNRLIRAIDISSGVVSILAGRLYDIAYSDGFGSEATFSFACGITINSAGTTALVVSFPNSF
jgi:hypothetical protein